MGSWNLNRDGGGVVALVLLSAALLTAPAASAAVECRYTDSHDTLGGTETGGGSIHLDPPNIQVRYDPPADGGPRTADVWDVTPFAPLFGPLRTGVEPVDQRLAEALEEHPGVGEGVAVWSERVTRFEIHGETPEVRRTRRELVSCEPAEAPPAAFEVPSGFSYQEPVIYGLGGEPLQEPPGG